MDSNDLIMDVNYMNFGKNRKKNSTTDTMNAVLEFTKPKSNSV